jgi:hypothetical protein
MGISRTIEKIREKYFFQKMCSVITKYVQTCELCCQRKSPVKKTNATIMPMPVPEGPWIRVSTDLLGRLPKCKDTGNMYVLVFIDYFTKAVELIALPDMKAETVARAFVERVILRHGSPSYLHSDRGTQYLSTLVLEVCKLFNVKKTQTTSFHPACNGQSERQMSTILSSLSKLLQDKHNIWDQYLPFVQFAYNTTPCLDTTTYSPFFLNHGRYPRMPIDAHLYQFNDVPIVANEFVAHTVQQLQFAHKTAEQILRDRKENMIKKSEQNSFNPQFQVGDVVYIYDPVIIPGNSPKLSRMWAGPYYIIEKPSPLHAKLRRVWDNKIIRNKVHINRLKHGCLRSGLNDLAPPVNVDACEPIVLDVNEVLDMNELPDIPVNNDVSSDNDKLYIIEKILRKKFYDNKWHYRIKWQSFPSNENSWVTFNDLSPECQQLVLDKHDTFKTDKNSEKK